MDYIRRKNITTIPQYGIDIAIHCDKMIKNNLVTNIYPKFLQDVARLVFTAFLFIL